MRFLLPILLWLLLPVLSTRGQTPTNLLTNPGFEGGTAAGVPEGWQPLWTRTPGVGAMALDTSIKHSGSAALKVTLTGGEDWSVEQVRRLPVTSGDIYRLGAWVRCENTDSAQVSVVTRRANGDVMDWMYGAAGTGGTHDWGHLARVFVVPAGCATIQFRLTGSGKGTIWLDEAELVRVGTVPPLRSKGAALRIGNQFLDVGLSSNGLLAVRDRRIGRAWRQQAVSANVIVTGAQRQGPSALRLALWDVASDLHLTATLALAADAPEMTVTVQGAGAVSDMIAFPQPFVTGGGTWLVVPLNEGIIYPVDDASINPMQLVAYSGHGICMPWFGVTDPRTGAGVMAILGTPDDARIDITRQPGGGLFIRPLWDASRGQFGYARKLTYIFLDKGGYVAQAKRYRRYAQQTGLFKTLAQKRRANPNVDKLVGAVNVWNWDMDKVALCHEMKALGMDHVLWSSGGSPPQVAAINALGYLTSRYDIYQDVYPPDAPAWLPKEGWPQDLVWLPDGDWMKGWADIEKHPDGTQVVYQGGVINSARGLARAKREIPDDLQKTPYHCRFIDTTTASPWREDYNPAHPLTRSQDRRYKMALLDFCANTMKLVVGTETGIDPSVPYADYYEGMLSLGPYRLPDAGRDMLAYKPPTPDFLKFQVGHFYRVPLWELVYHECVVADWYWGDYNNKVPEVWDRRDLFNILYGTPPMFMFDKAAWEKDKPRFVQSYRNICPLVRREGYDEMLAHDFLTPDHAVQRTRWRSGTQIIVNFGTTPYHFAGGTVKPMGWLVSRAGVAR
ncbi:MAG: carbohydrate binding domain-containing protein [Armatimonadetes bacterium]|nr:carbohydrate binding domain-containing protein [Armatimonadota bacterium]